MLALIPVKRFSDAKSRLAGTHRPEQRADLARGLAETVIRAARATHSLRRVFVLTSDSDATRLARELGAETLLEPPGDKDFNSLVATALDTLSDYGARQLLYLASDLPDLTPDALSEFISAHNTDVSIGRAARDGGTNALLFDVPRRFALAFGIDSAQRHLTNALASGLTARMIHVEQISNDLDVPPLDVCE